MHEMDKAPSGKTNENMHEMDKAAFGKFLSGQRKAKGYTQKELAQKLFVSDKAVSKWERVLSMPDISLLMPLADILEVSVTEILEGRKMDQTSGMDAVQVENLVKKALAFSEEAPEKRKARQKKYAVIFSGCVLVAALELVIGLTALSRLGMLSGPGSAGFLTTLLTLEVLSFIPASNEPSSHACMDIWRLPRGSNTPPLGASLLKRS